MHLVMSFSFAVSPSDAKQVEDEAFKLSMKVREHIVRQFADAGTHVDPRSVEVFSKSTIAAFVPGG